MFNSRIAFFKVPPELVPAELGQADYFPANYSTKIHFNVELYNEIAKNPFIDSRLNVDFLNLNIERKLRHNEILIRDLNMNHLGKILMPRKYKIRKSLITAFQWGCEIKKQNKIVIAWNKQDPDSISLKESGVNIVWVENGYKRDGFIYVDGPLSEIIHSKSITTCNVSFSELYNLFDIIFDVHDRFSSISYYLQMMNRRFSKLRKSRIVNSGMSEVQKNAGLNILFIAQLDFDYNTILSGGNFDFREVLKLMSEFQNSCFDKSISFHVRLHPNSSRYYLDVLHEFDFCKIDTSDSLSDAVNFFDAALTINSSGSTEFIERLKPVFFLGDGEFVEFVGNRINDLNEVFDTRLNYHEIAMSQKENLSTYLTDYHLKREDFVGSLLSTDFL
jgi:hypothetical protein